VPLCCASDDRVATVGARSSSVPGHHDDHWHQTPGRDHEVSAQVTQLSLHSKTKAFSFADNQHISRRSVNQDVCWRLMKRQADQRMTVKHADTSTLTLEMWKKIEEDRNYRAKI